MKSKKCWVLTILALTIVMVACYFVIAEEPPKSPGFTYLHADTREVLVGLKGVYVLVEELPPEVEKNGFLTREAIQTDVELELRKYGIKILSQEERLRDPGHPYLYVNLICLINPYSRYSGNILVSLRENVMVERRLGTWILGAITWHCGGVFQNAEPNYIRETIKEYVDKFINDYLAANPKEQVSIKDTNDSSNH